jgi:hypothetical protein
MVIAIRRRELAANTRSDPPLIVRSDGKPVIRPPPPEDLMKGAGGHGATVSRECGLPAVVGGKDATRNLRQGEMVEINGTTREVVRIQAQATTN